MVCNTLTNWNAVCFRIYIRSKVHKCRRQGALSIINTKHLPLSSHASTKHSTEKDVLLYRWPTMRHFRFISRFKVYQVSTMLLLLPPVAYWYHLGEISTRGLISAGVAALGTTAVLFVVSHYFQRVVGEMVYCSHSSSVKVSTLTLMGGRRDLYFPIDRIVPFIDSQRRMGGAIQRLEIRGHPEVFLYSLRYGRVINSNLMFHVLGIQAD